MRSSLLQAAQDHLPQGVIVQEMPQISTELFGPPLDMLQWLYILLVLGPGPQGWMQFSIWEVIRAM